MRQFYVNTLYAHTLLGQYAIIADYAPKRTENATAD
jgi:hypothetical protein